MTSVQMHEVESIYLDGEKFPAVAGHRAFWTQKVCAQTADGEKLAVTLYHNGHNVPNLKALHMLASAIVAMDEGEPLRADLIERARKALGGES